MRAGCGADGSQVSAGARAPCQDSRHALPRRQAFRRGATRPSPARPRTNGPHGSTHHHSVDRFFLNSPLLWSVLPCGARQRQRPAPQPMTWNCMPGPTPCGTTTDSLDAKGSETALRRGAPPRRLQGVAGFAGFAGFAGVAGALRRPQLCSGADRATVRKRGGRPPRAEGGTPPPQPGRNVWPAWPSLTVPARCWPVKGDCTTICCPGTCVEHKPDLAAQRGPSG